MLIDELLEIVRERKASDLHISTGLPPVIRVDGELTRIDMPPLTSDDVESLIFPILL